jgi:two-component system CheB/CheR fusion protein
MNIDIGLPAEKLQSALRGVLSGKQPGQSIVIEATNRRGRQVSCTIRVSPLGTNGTDPPRGVIVFMEAEEG